MATFCDCCNPSNDTYLCQACGSIKCAGRYRPKWMPVPNAAHEGNVCPMCQATDDRAPATALLQAQGVFAAQRRIYADAADIGVRIDGGKNKNVRKRVRDLVKEYRPKVSKWANGRTYNFGGFEITWCLDRPRRLEFLSFQPL